MHTPKHIHYHNWVFHANFVSAAEAWYKDGEVLWTVNLIIASVTGVFILFLSQVFSQLYRRAVCTAFVYYIMELYRTYLHWRLVKLLTSLIFVQLLRVAEMADSVRPCSWRSQTQRWQEQPETVPDPLKIEATTFKPNLCYNKMWLWMLSPKLLTLEFFAGKGKR